MPLIPSQNRSVARLSSRWIGAVARTFVPFGGPILSNHLENFAVQDIELPTFPDFDAKERILILSPHPDDEVLGTGGLIARARAKGLNVDIAFLTNGDGSRTTQLVLNAKNPLHKRTLFEIACDRQIEALGAANALGVSESNVHFLGFPDGANLQIMHAEDENEPITSPTTGKTSVEYEKAFLPGVTYSRRSLIQALVQLMEQTKPTIILTTHPLDTHLDHKAAFLALEAARKQLKNPPDLWTFLIHYGIWPVPNGLKPDKRLAPPYRLLDGATQWYNLELNEEEIAIKQSALQHHATQMASTPRYLSAFVRRNELFGKGY
jgi:LmbE family N-acetylglucosaminyl deacetylase